MLFWRTVTPSSSPAHLVKGTEIEVCFPAGYHYRFAVYSVRASQWQRDPAHIDGGYVVYDMRYRVRDAATVSDADVRAGKRPAIAFETGDLDAALGFIQAQAPSQIPDK